MQQKTGKHDVRRLGDGKWYVFYMGYQLTEPGQGYHEKRKARIVSRSMLDPEKYPPQI